MNNYHKTLGVHPNASIAEIKRAYRKTAKKLHPDVSGEDASKFHILTQAYEQLLLLHANSTFDMPIFTKEWNKKGTKDDKGFSYREWLSQRKDEESYCKLIFWDLMHNREDDAVKAFKKINTEKAEFKLSKWFSREDFMDYGFILAEELSFRSEYYDAYLLLKQIIVMEQTFPYFKLFFPEVMSFTRDILRFRIETSVNDELALDAWESALDLDFPNKDKAAFLLKMAGGYYRMGDIETAKICINEAVRLDSSIQIPKKIKITL